MAVDDRWYFTKEDIVNTPSRKCGIDGEKELSYRQQGAKLIQDMGQRLQVTQLVINTAIVYMHRFYMFHPFTKFHRNSIAPAALFLAAKVEEQPRKLEHVIKVGHYILCHHEHTNLDTQSEPYQDKAQELVMNENILLQTLGFDVAIDHPHTHVVKCFQMVRSKCSCPTATTELAQTSYFMATNSLHMTTMCLQYQPSVVACVCIYIVCKWSNYEIQRYTEGKDWFAHVDPTVTLEMLENLTTEFLAVLDKYPSRLKKLMNSGGPHAGPSTNFGDEKAVVRHNSVPVNIRPQVQAGASAPPRIHELAKPGMSKATTQPPPVQQKTVISHKEYAEKREREKERLERQDRDKERERSDREKLHASSIAPPSSRHLSSGHPMAALHISASSSSSHQRPQPFETLMRKSHAEGTRPNVPGAPRASPAFKEPIPKREIIRSDEKEERTSVNSLIDSSAKLVPEKLKSSSDIRHSVDWNQSRQLEYINKDRKDIKLQTKSEFKPIIKDNKVINDNREHIKPDSYSKHYNNNNSNKNVIKSETPPIAKIKVEKVEIKEEPKVQGVKEVKHNSFIFNNNDFSSLRDFLNPSEIPPDDIFDTEVDTKPLFNSADFLPGETTHHKLNSPPRHHPVTSNQNQSTLHTTTASSSTVAKGNNSSSNSNTSSSKQAVVEAVHTESKPSSRHINPSTASNNNVHTRGNHSSEKNNLGNGLPNAHNVMQSTLQTPSVRRKEKMPSPRSVVSQASTAKVKLQRLETTVIPPSIKFDDRRHLTTKDLQSPIKQNLLKDPVTTSQISTVVVATTTSTPPGKPSTTTTQSQSYTPVKQIPDHLKADSLSIRLPRPESIDPVSAVSANSTVTGSINSGSTVVPSQLKANKQEHRSHKHKEKKKHKHKEKDKHKDKDSKEHKKARKHKKKDKEKDKEREKDKDKKAEKQTQKDSSQPLKLTIMRGKGICGTPDVVATNTTQITLPTPVLEKESTSTSSMDTPGRIKLTIPKSRLQVNTTGGGQSPPRGIPTEIATPKVKLKIPKDSSRPEKDRENRKRERDRSSPPEINHAKVPRTSGYNAPQVGSNYHLDSTLSKKPFKAKHKRQPPHSQHVQQFPISQPHNNPPRFNPPRPDHPHPYQQPPPYPIEYGMNASMNSAPVYHPYGGMPPTRTNPSFGHQGSIPPPNHQYYQPQQQPPYQPQPHFQPQQSHSATQSFQSQPHPQYVTTQHEPPPYYPQYTHSVPNMSMPPPLVYNLPPPNYVHQPYIPPQPQVPENPPLPTEPPPKTPSPPPPPE